MSRDTCDECGRSCDDCERIEPFEVEQDFNAHITEDEDVYLTYLDSEVDLENIAETILLFLKRERKEMEFQITQKWSKDGREIHFYFERRMHVVADISGPYTIFLNQVILGKYKYIGACRAYQIGEEIVIYLKKNYLSENDQIIKDIIE